MTEATKLQAEIKDKASTTSSLLDFLVASINTKLRGLTEAESRQNFTGNNQNDKVKRYNLEFSVEYNLKGL